MSLSPQQRLCLLYISHGMTSKEVGEIMGLSPRTVEAYLHIIKDKIGIRKKSRLIRWFLVQHQKGGIFPTHFS